MSLLVGSAACGGSIKLALKKLRATNFRSFEHLDVEFGDFNVLIGANAAGKSNLVQCLKLLRDIGDEGLDNAISMQGGLEYLRNVNLSSSEFSLEARFKESSGLVLGLLPGQRVFASDILVADIEEIGYQLGLKLTSDSRHFEVVDEKVTFPCEFVFFHGYKSMTTDDGRDAPGQALGNGEIRVSRSADQLKLESTSPPSVQETLERYVKPRIEVGTIARNESMVHHPYFAVDVPLRRLFQQIATYDFDPKLAKRAAPLAGRKILDEDGSNLAIVLRNILDDESDRREFSNLLRDLIPSIADVGVQRFVDRSLVFNLREKYGDTSFPAFLLSDGTVGVAALIAAMYFGEAPVVVVEEPERNIHPHLISKVVDMLREVSRRRQVIVTTQSPQVVESAGLDNILLVSRDSGGFSTVTRPSELFQVREFLRNDIGLDELYTQNLLGA